MHFSVHGYEFSRSKTLYSHTWTNPLMIVLVRPPLAAAIAITKAIRPTTPWNRTPDKKEEHHPAVLCHYTTVKQIKATLYIINTKPYI